MTRLEACIEALKSYDSDEDKIFIYRSDAIAIVERIFGAEPREEECENVVCESNTCPHIYTAPDDVEGGGGTSYCNLAGKTSEDFEKLRKSNVELVKALGKIEKITYEKQEDVRKERKYENIWHIVGETLARHRGEGEAV